MAPGGMQGLTSVENMRQLSLPLMSSSSRWVELSYQSNILMFVLGAYFTYVNNCDPSLQSLLKGTEAKTASALFAVLLLSIVFKSVVAFLGENAASGTGLWQGYAATGLQYICICVFAGTLGFFASRSPSPAEP